MNIFVGNLSFDAVEADVKKIFKDFGSVSSVVIVMNSKGVKSRGFGFVEMPDQAQAEAAIAALSGKELLGRPLKVSSARPRPMTDTAQKEGKAKWAKFKGNNTGIQSFREDKEGKRTGGRRRFSVTNRYKEGRRSRNWRAANGKNQQELVVPNREGKKRSVPMRRKQERPWQKAQRKSEPLKNPEGRSVSQQRSSSDYFPRQSRKNRNRSGGYKR